MNMSDSYVHQKVNILMSANLRHTSKTRTFRAKNEVQLSTFDNNSGIFGTAREPMRPQTGH